MSITVCKFGGSSVADAGMFARILRIIGSDPARRYIVLSAPGKRNRKDQKITDLLLQAHEASCRGDYSILAQIFERYAAIRRCLAPGFNLEMEFMRIRRLLHTSRDYAASRGEYLCAKLFSAYSGWPFVDASELIFFSENGSIDMPRSRDAVQEKLLCHDRAVIPGFYGTDASGQVKTFTRGGSDVSGALIAALTGANLYENWTDVDGLFTADPGIVEKPLRNRRVSLAQMEMICAAGAKLLHPDALSPLKGTGIDTEIKNTFRPGAEGTRISEAFSGTVQCVTGRKDLFMIGKDTAIGEPVLYQLPPDDSIPVAVVRAFGITDMQHNRISEILKPIHIINMRDYIEYIIPVREYETAVCLIHEILVEYK